MFRFWILFLFLTLTKCVVSKPVKLVIMHPTQKNVDNYVWLIENKIIQLEEYELIGFYHTGENYDYSVVKKRQNLILIPCNGNIGIDLIFRPNECTFDFEKVFKMADAVFFSGGPDIPAQVYGEKNYLTTEITDPIRHYFEISFLFHLLGRSTDSSMKPLLISKPNFPVWCFCLGMQSLNVACGGSLWQDIPMNVYGLSYMEDILSFDQSNVHKNYYHQLSPIENIGVFQKHPIKFVQDFELYDKIYANQLFNVFSWHHQAVKDIGNDLEVISSSEDGKIVELIKHKAFSNVIGFQFHPENSDIYKKNITMDSSFRNTDEFALDQVSLNFHIDLWNNFSKLLVKPKN